MSGLISIYLDIFRFLAALGVFYSHAQQHAGAPGVLPPLYLDHKLVIFFFVISGYVIAASASRPDRTLANYSADRLARLSSVVIPALVFTAILDFIGMTMSPSVYSLIDPRWQPLRFLVNFFYCQQIWFLSVNPGSNTPLWSLGYEFWYYVLFGVWIFVRQRWTRIAALLLIALFIGPKILLLLPAWVAGALAFHASKKLQPSYRNSLLLFIASGLVVALAAVFDVQLHLTNGAAGQPPLFYSSDFIGDNIFSFLVAAHFLACALFSRHLLANFEPYRIVRFIRWLAGHTFSLYVYHMPILYFLRAVLRYNPYNLSLVLLALGLTLLLIAGLSKITEERYPVLRTVLRGWMGGFLDRVRPVAIRWKLSPAAPTKIS
jgi:peptidoglycan/LPS O-acetylase OafA/YrhL